MPPVELIDSNALAEAKQTMQAKFSTMIGYYLEDSASYIAAVREGIEAGSAERIVSPAHTLKSSSQQMGALRLSSIAKEIETLAREQSSVGKSDMAPFKPLIEALEATFAETKTALPAQAA